MSSSLPVSGLHLVKKQREAWNIITVYTIVSAQNLPGLFFPLCWETLWQKTELQNEWACKWMTKKNKKQNKKMMTQWYRNFQNQILSIIIIVIIIITIVIIIILSSSFSSSSPMACTCCIDGCPVIIVAQQVFSKIQLTSVEPFWNV